MKNDKQLFKVNIQLWNGIAITSAIFSFIICFLIIANFLQINRLDPINTEVINNLVERLSQNPNDEALKIEIREIDLLARKAYFTNQWQIRTGGYLLLIGVIIFVVAMQMINSAKNIVPEIGEKDDNNLYLQKTARKWISIGGAGLVVIALFFAFLTHNKLGETFTNAVIAEKTLIEEDIQEEANIIQYQNENPFEEPPEAATEEKSETTETNSQESVNDVVKYSIADYPTAEMKANYPAFRGAGGNGVAYHKNIPVNWDGTSGENILWKSPVPLHGYNSPVIWGNKLFISGANATQKQVYCYDRNTGKLLWTANVDNIAGSPATAPAVTNDTGHSAPTVTTDGKKVFAIFSTGDIIALDMNGKRVWAKNLGVPQNHYGYSSSLYVYEDKLIVQYDHRTASKVMALSVNSGEVVWSTDRKGKISWASPIIVNTGNQVEILLVTDPFVASYNANTGKELWRFDCLYGEVGPSLAYANGIIFATNEYASLVALKLGEKPEKLWEQFDYLSDVPSPVATDKYLFLATSYGVVVCHDATTGEVFWEKEFDNGFYSSPILVEDKIYLLDIQGTMHIFKADKEYVSLGEPKLEEKAYSTPAFAIGRVYIRADKNLYCIGK
ncbi:MAG: PQQ-binding-like beta-propeller repeat protein [Bacteroidales bacterium]|jgi:outer membrane protein assembly factor BamB|nr:PQQ-binding-like beta-propeller repeat protein [Bacteroidales bacterium]